MDKKLQRLLEDAAWDGDAIAIAHLIQLPDVDPAADHSTALLHAAHRGHWRCVEILLTVSNPRERNSEALWRAARYRHPRCVLLLAPVSDTSMWSDDLWSQVPGRMRALIHQATLANVSTGRDVWVDVEANARSEDQLNQLLGLMPD